MAIKLRTNEKKRSGLLVRSLLVSSVALCGFLTLYLHSKMRKEMPTDLGVDPSLLRFANQSPSPSYPDTNQTNSISLENTTANREAVNLTSIAQMSTQLDETQPNPEKKVSYGKYSRARARHRNIELDTSEFDPVKLHASLQDFYQNNTPASALATSDLWENSETTIPEWMKRYFRWHKHMRQFVCADEKHANLNTTNFIVMQCLATDRNCGGVSDRLKPVPLLVRVAYYTKRLLFIYWNRPGSVEKFLVPPQGGVDWRLPSCLKPMVEDRSVGELVYNDEGLRGWPRSDLDFVRSRIQNYHGGMHAYDNQLLEGEPNFIQVFHHVWQAFFTPSQPVRSIIENDMKRLGLVPGEYVSAHLRVLYAMDTRRENTKQNWAINALNCASEIQPQKTIFFASDSANATYYAGVYAASKNAVLRTRVPNPNPPLHMDKVDNWRKRDISDFYDTFVDLYIMAQSTCMTYNKGGYGIMALFISRNWDCGVRQDAIDRPQIFNPCRWVDDPKNGTEQTKMKLALQLKKSNLSIYMEPMEEATST